jgi:hypothetical protein
MDYKGDVQDRRSIVIRRNADPSPGLLSDAELEAELTLASLSRVPMREERFASLLAEKRRRRFSSRKLA